jgi:hypothetical protein
MIRRNLSYEGYISKVDIIRELMIIMGTQHLKQPLAISYEGNAIVEELTKRLCNTY